MPHPPANRRWRAVALPCFIGVVLLVVAAQAGHADSTDPAWPTVEGYPEIDEWLYESQDNPVNEDPEKYLDPDGPLNDNWIGNPSYDENSGPTPDSQLKNPEYLEGTWKKKQQTDVEMDPIRGDDAVWVWEVVA